MIVVTGANGLLGSQVCKQLSESEVPYIAMCRPNAEINLLPEGAEVVEGDVLDAYGLFKIFEGVDAVIHCAAVVSYHKQDAQLMYKVNAEGTKNVVNACLEAGVEQLIHISSIAAIGRQPGKLNLDEKATWVESEMNSTYARTKHLAELEVWRGHHEGLKVCVLNPSVVLAAGNAIRSSGQLLKYVWDGKPYYIDGEVNYVDVRDVAEVVVMAYVRKIDGERFILNAGTISYGGLFTKIARVFGIKGPSIKVNLILLKFIYIVDSLKFFLTRIRPVVTKEMLKSTRDNFVYSSEKSRAYFEMKYRPLNETLEWACTHFKEQLKK